MKRILIVLVLFLTLSISGCADTPAPEQAVDVARNTAAAFSAEDIPLQSTPGSSCFSHVGYDKEHEVLVVQFRDSGSKYSYSDFSISDWDSFINADSLGKHYNANIKGKFLSERLYD